MNVPEPIHIRRWRGPLAFVLLSVAIAILARDLVPKISTEFRIRKANEMVSHNPARALQALEKSAAEASERQREIGLQVARDAMARLRGDRPLLRQVGPYPFDPAALAQPYVTANNEMMLTFELPQTLKPFGPRIRVSTEGQDLCEVHLSEDGTTGRGEVPLSRGESLVADVDLVCPVGAYGVISTPIAHGLRLVQKSEGPTLRLRAGERVFVLREGQIERLQVARGTRLQVELNDGLGLRDLAWSVDGVAHDPFDWSDERNAFTRTASLPEDLTSQSANRRAIELKASNTIGLPTRAAIDLLVRDPGVNPIAAATIDRRRLEDAAIIHSAEKSLQLVVTMAKGELPEDLVVVWDDRPQRAHVTGQDVTAVLSADLEGIRQLVLQARDQTLVRASVHFDWTPPTVIAVLDPGRFSRDLEVRRALHEAPIGSVVSVTIADAMGLDRPLVNWAHEGGALEEVVDPDLPDPPSQRSWTRRFRCAEAGEGVVRVFGSDLAGNRTTTHEYRVRVADPMEGRVVTVNGRPFSPTNALQCSEARLVVRTEGGIDVDGLGFFVFDPAQQNAELGHVLLERGDQAKTRQGTIDLGFLGTSGRTVLGVLSRNERQLLKGEIVFDFAAPVFRVVDLEAAGERDGVPGYFAEPGQQVSLSLSDDVAIDFSSISVLSGATIEGLLPTKDDVGVVLVLPAVLEEPVVVKAADEAGNVGELRFDVIVRREAESRPRDAERPPSRPSAPQPRPSPDGSPPPPEHPAPLEELQSAQKITHPALGSFVLVSKNGDPFVPPFYVGEHELRVKEWRTFVSHLQQRGAASLVARGGNPQALVSEAVKVLNFNTNVQQTKGEEEPLAGTTSDLVRAYVTWANEIGRDRGVWKVPSLLQWQLAAGRALHPNALYPITATFSAGNDLSNQGNGGALFARDIIAVREMPKRALLPGAFGIHAMPGSLYEWVVDSQGRLRLTGGSMTSPKEACRLDAPPLSEHALKDYQRGLRLVLLPRAR
jgi:hypothetical protein